MDDEADLVGNPVRSEMVWDHRMVSDSIRIPNYVVLAVYNKFST